MCVRFLLQGQARRSPLTLAHGQHQQNAINVSVSSLVPYDELSPSRV
jgi:hypothetical protein